MANPNPPKNFADNQIADRPLKLVTIRVFADDAETIAKIPADRRQAVLRQIIADGLRDQGEVRNG